MSGTGPFGRCALALGFVGATLALSTRAMAAPCPPSAGDCTVLLDQGSAGANIDVAFMGDGYTNAERDKFVADAGAMAQALFSDGPYGAYKPVFNAVALFTPSAQSGADDPSAGFYVSTAFDATYDSYGISYLIVVSTGKVLYEATTRFPAHDIVIMLVNSTQYGGSGGSVAVVSLDGSSVEIARHELAHTLAGLADEYATAYPGYPDGDSEPNVAFAANLAPVKWLPWLTAGTPVPTSIQLQLGLHTPVGAYEGARYKAVGMFRPTPQCKMRALGVTFCPICEEALSLKISQLSSLIDAPSPSSPTSVPTLATAVFSATLPALPNLDVTWTLDGTLQAPNGPLLSLTPLQAGLGVGAHSLTLTVADQTPAVLSDPSQLMIESHTWSITVTPSDCATPGVPEGAACDDDDACTKPDACQGGACVGALAVLCPTRDACHAIGVCDPIAGECSSSNAPDGTACDDGDACTTGDACESGSCVAGSPVVCVADAPCHVAGSCDPTSGACTNPNATDGTPCDDGDACTLIDGCESGACLGEKRVTCKAADACHAAGTCAPDTGACSNPEQPDGTPCAGGACEGGECAQTPDEGEPTCDGGGCSQAPDEGEPRCDGGPCPPPVTPTAAPSGCGCRVAGGDDDERQGGAGAFLGVALAALARARRARRDSVEV